MGEDIDNLINMLKIVGTKFSYEKICEFNEEERKKYNILLENFKKTNSSDSTTNQKGKALEDLAAYTIKTSHIFDIYKNLRTSTNELGQLVKKKKAEEGVVAAQK